MAALTLTGSVDGLNASFTAATEIGDDAVLVLNGAIQRLNTDYSVVGTTTFRFVVAPLVGDVIWWYAGEAGLPLAGSSGSDSWDTAADIINDAMTELGLAQSDVSDPFAQTEQNWVLMCRVLKSAGRELVKVRRWTHLQKEYTFATVSSTASYELPSDFREMADQSIWDRTEQDQVDGPLSQQAWQMFQGSAVAAPTWPYFRLVNGQISLYPTPSSVRTIAFEYLSRWWVKPSGQSAPTTDTPSAASDVLCFDPLLLVRRLVYDFCKAKGDSRTATALEDYRAALNAVESEDNAAPILSLNGGGGLGTRLIDWRNVPDTDFGS